MMRRAGNAFADLAHFLGEQLQGVAAIDMFVVARASFQLLYVTVFLGHDRRKNLHAADTEQPTPASLARHVAEAFRRTW